MSYSENYLKESTRIIEKIDPSKIEEMVKKLVTVKKNSGRLFILGVGGSAANASHAVNDFRKISGIESYTPTDNVSELTARINDEGWDSCFSAWLKGSRLSKKDAVLVLSVGGGNEEKKISTNIVEALKIAQTPSVCVCVCV